MVKSSSGYSTEWCIDKKQKENTPRGTGNILLLLKRVSLSLTLSYYVVLIWQLFYLDVLKPDFVAVILQ